MKPLKSNNTSAANVCFIAKYPYPLDTRLVQQATSLVQNNIHVDIICLKAEQMPSFETTGPIAIHRLIHKKAKESFLEYVTSTVLFGLLSTIKLFQLRMKRKFSVVVVCTLPEALVFFVFWIKFTGAGLILDARDLTVELLASRWQVPTINIIRTLFILVERLSMGLCGDVITASNGFMRSLVDRKIPQRKIAVIFNTSDTSIFKPDPKREFLPIQTDLRMLYHGTVSHRFGVMIAVEAVGLIRRVFPNVKFFIYGSYDPGYLKSIKQRIEALNIHDNITMGGFLDLGEIYEIIKSVHIGVVAYLSDPFMNQALSTKTFEYIAAGLPVVASRLKSCEELFDDSCIQYAIPGDANDLAEKIIEFAHNPSLRKQKSKAALQQFQQYSDIVMNERFLGVIKKYL